MFLRPMIILLIRLYPVENQIPKLYGLKLGDLNFYLLFSFVIIIAQIFMDICLLNNLELLHGFKLFDYFNYCSYR